MAIRTEAHLRPGDEGDGEALGAEAPRAAHAVQVLVGLVGEVVGEGSHRGRGVWVSG